MKYIILVLAVFSIFLLSAQQPDSEISASVLESFNAERLQINKTGMTILGTWAVSNMLIGGVQSFRTTGATQSFHQMNVGWNAVNLAIAGFGLYSALTTAPTSDLWSSINAQKSIETTLLFNAGLDVGYMLGGLYLIERSKRGGENADRLLGFGRSVVLQGAFLFAFDVVMAVVHQKHWATLEPTFSLATFGNTLQQSTLQMGFAWHF
jgi:hypothetical protein